MSALYVPPAFAKVGLEVLVGGHAEFAQLYDGLVHLLQVCEVSLLALSQPLTQDIVNILCAPAAAV
jgi:hypothetical protein